MFYSTGDKNLKWFITGGCGFIGTALSKKLLSEGGHQIRIYDNLSVGTKDDLRELVGPYSDLTIDDVSSSWDGPLSQVTGDILDLEMVNKAMQGADVVVHLAANTGVGPSVEDPMSDCTTNVQGTLNVLEACRKNDVNRFVFASSGAPLGVQTPPLHEEMAAHPASPYGASKLAGEGYCSAYYHCFGVETVVLRFGNVYGEGSTKKASVVAKFIKQAIAGETLEIYGDGSQTRDFIHISDLIDAVIAAGTKAGVGGEKFQIATSAETTVGEITEKLIDALKEAGIPAKMFNGENRQGDVARNFSDTTKAKNVLGWQAKVNLEQGLRQTIAFFTDK
jgi:UDP-glucose 4-epimerase